MSEPKSIPPPVHGIDQIDTSVEPISRNPITEMALYVNMASVTFTPEEAYIVFGQRDPVDPSQGSTVVRVAMSIPHAKRLTAALVRTIEGWEQNFGEILDPDKRLTDSARARLEKEATSSE